MTKMIDVKCAYCGNIILKELREYKRQIKKDPNKRFFCNLSCTAHQRNKDSPPKGDTNRFGKAIRVLKHDEYSPFRYFILRAKSRTKSKTKRNFEFDLDLEYLKNLWGEQNGICPITGKFLILPKGTDGWDEMSPYNASLDRIDNSKGYIKGNVRYIAYIANLGRSAFSDEQLISFCKVVTAHQTKL